MESRYDSMLQSLTELRKKLQNGEVTAEDNNLLPLILIRLQQLDTYVVSEFSFGNQPVDKDIVEYAGLLESFGRNVGDKIDFFIDLGNERGGWDGDIGRYIEEALEDIQVYSGYLNNYGY